MSLSNIYHILIEVKLGDSCIINISRVKVVVIKDYHSFNLMFQFVRKNKISKSKKSKKTKIESPLWAP